METNYPENKLTYVTFSVGWDGMCVAHHLQQEGQESILAQVQDFSELGIEKEKEEPEDKKERLSQYDGMIRKYPAEKMFKALLKVKDKSKYFLFFDQNQLFKYAEPLLKAGFTKGNFPTEADYLFEKNREDAMNFVDENYPDIQQIPHQKFSTVEEARQAVEEAETPLVIQSEGDFVGTIVGPDDVEDSKTTILAALDKHEKDYSKGEIIIKEKLVQPIEITPQMIFWNGEPVFTDLDIETKNIGDGENNGNQVGCGTNLIVATDIDDKINRIAFPPAVYKMAKEHPGIFVWDISLYFTEKGIFFGEFCSNRYGYDALMTEMTMAHGPSEFWGKIMEGANPLEHFKFGTALRAFNLNRNKDQEITVNSWKPTWLYEVKMKDGKFVSVGDCWDLGVITGRGNTIEEAVDNLYDNYDTFVFKEKYARSKADFLADYPTSIIHRFKETNGVYFNAPAMAEKESSGDFGGMAKQIKDIEEKIITGLEGVQSLTEAIKDVPKVKKSLAQKIKEKLNGKS